MAGLTIEQFWGMTPHELGLHFEGYAQRLKAHQRLLAWHAAICVSPHVKDRVRPSDLMRDDEDW